MHYVEAESPMSTTTQPPVQNSVYGSGSAVSTGRASPRSFDAFMGIDLETPFRLAAPLPKPRLFRAKGMLRNRMLNHMRQNRQCPLRPIKRQQTSQGPPADPSRLTRCAALEETV